MFVLLRLVPFSSDVYISMYGFENAWQTVHCFMTFSFIDDIYSALKQSSSINLIQLPTSIEFPSTNIVKESGKNYTDNNNDNISGIQSISTNTDGKFYARYWQSI